MKLLPNRLGFIGLDVIIFAGVLIGSIVIGVTTVQNRNSVADTRSQAACASNEIFCGGCINGCRRNTQTCNRWIDQECNTSTECAGNGVSYGNRECCPGLIKCTKNGRCGTTCEAPSTPIPNPTPFPTAREFETMPVPTLRNCPDSYRCMELSDIEDFRLQAFNQYNPCPSGQRCARARAVASPTPTRVSGRCPNTYQCMTLDDISALGLQVYTANNPCPSGQRCARARAVASPTPTTGSTTNQNDRNQKKTECARQGQCVSISEPVQCIPIGGRDLMGIVRVECYLYENQLVWKPESVQINPTITPINRTLSATNTPTPSTARAPVVPTTTSTPTRTPRNTSTPTPSPTITPVIILRPSFTNTPSPGSVDPAALGNIRCSDSSTATVCNGKTSGILFEFSSDRCARCISDSNNNCTVESFSRANSECASLLNQLDREAEQNQNNTFNTPEESIVSNNNQSICPINTRNLNHYCNEKTQNNMVVSDIANGECKYCQLLSQQNICLVYTVNRETDNRCQRLFASNRAIPSITSMSQSATEQLIRNTTREVCINNHNGCFVERTQSCVPHNQLNAGYRCCSQRFVADSGGNCGSVVPQTQNRPTVNVLPTVQQTIAPVSNYNQPITHQGITFNPRFSANFVPALQPCINRSILLRPDGCQKLEQIILQLRQSGIEIWVNAGYRSYSQQEELYNAFINGNGVLTAPPGMSDHQSGCAVDLYEYISGGRTLAIHPNSQAGQILMQQGISHPIPLDTPHYLVCQP